MTVEAAVCTHSKMSQIRCVVPEWAVRVSLKKQTSQKYFLRQNKTTVGTREKKHPATRAVAVLVRWQLVLLFLSSAVALCCPSGREEEAAEEEGVVSSFCLYFFLHPVDPVTGARAWVCLGRETSTSDRLLLPRAQLERTRAVHVTSHLAEQATEARGRRGRL